MPQIDAQILALQIDAAPTATPIAGTAIEATIRKMATNNGITAP
jgi:hypothetical protein